MWSMLPKIPLQITQLAVRSSSTGSYVRGVNLFVLVVFVADDFALPFLSFRVLSDVLEEKTYAPGFTVRVQNSITYLVPAP